MERDGQGMDRSENRSIQSVETTASIIDALRQLGGAGVSEVGNDVDLSPGAVHTHLQTLERIGYVVQSTDGYDLGPELLALGEYVRHNHPLYRAAHEEIDEIAERVGECVHLVIEHHGRLYAVYEQFGSGAVGAEYHNRKRQQSFDPHCTAAGKAILAYEDDSRRQKIIDESALEAQTESTITTKSELIEELQDVRHRGYATADEEQMLGIRAVSAPVLDDDGVVGAIAVSGPVSKFQGDFFREELPEVVNHAKTVCEVNLQAQSAF